MTMSFNPRWIEGKWNKKRYQVHRELGRGTTGIVYLVTHRQAAYALKLGEDPLSISAEVNILRKFQGDPAIVGPTVFDVDDWEEPGRVRPFYVMNVIEGMSLSSFVQERGKAWVPVLIIQLLDFLQALHQEGFVFGDLKPENLKVCGQPPRLAWLDPGGITKMGWAIKEYTEPFDRASWQMGDRRAEPAYDLFSLALIFISLYTGQSLKPLPINAGEDNREALRAYIFQHSALKFYREPLWKAVTGRYRQAVELKRELLTSWYQAKEQPKQRRHQPVKQRKGSTLSSSYRPPAKRGMISGLITFFFLSSFFIFLFALYLFSQTL